MDVLTEAREGTWWFIIVLIAATPGSLAIPLLIVSFGMRWARGSKLIKEPNGRS